MEKEQLTKKWGEKSLLFGWSAVPVSLLLMQRKLGLTPLGINILLHLISLWWEKDKHPYPSQAGIAEKIGVSPRTVQRELISLKKKGLLATTRTSIQDPKFSGRNIYDLTPLVEKLQEFSQELHQEKKQKKGRK